jgi:tetratricopeptide (TPR) repeat protein
MASSTSLTSLLTPIQSRRSAAALLSVALGVQSGTWSEAGGAEEGALLTAVRAGCQIPWFAVGSYYFLIGNNDEARRYFNKATQLDVNLGPAWIGFGHAFAAEVWSWSRRCPAKPAFAPTRLCLLPRGRGLMACTPTHPRGQGEHDQAMAAYCTAARLLPGSHLPLMYIGMEYTHTNNLSMALRYFERARLLCSTFPLWRRAKHRCALPTAPSPTPTVRPFSR